MRPSAALTKSARDERGSTSVTTRGALRVIIIDDDDLFRESLRLNLVDQEIDVAEFSTGADALEYFAGEGGADVILLDWKMPGMDGLEVLRRLRDTGIEIPVIFLTTLSDQIYEEAALEKGAVDFIEKSRSFSIILRRMRIIAEGRKPASGGGGASSDTRIVGGLELNMTSSRAVWRGTAIALTLREFKIVALLALKAGRDVTYRDIYDVVHGEGFVAGYGVEGYRANVRTFIKRVRQKFRETDGSFEQIENYPGFGYSWRVDDQE